MPSPPKLSADQIREVGEILFGNIWQVDMAKSLGVPRQSVGYYLKAGGVSGSQAAAIVGLVARMAAREGQSLMEAQAAAEARRRRLSDLLHRLEAALGASPNDRRPSAEAPAGE